MKPALDALPGIPQILGQDGKLLCLLGISLDLLLPGSLAEGISEGLQQAGRTERILLGAGERNGQEAIGLQLPGQPGSKRALAAASKAGDE